MISKCDICKDDGLCRNNKKNPNYSEDDSDYLDCWVYLRRYVETDRDYKVEVWDINKKTWTKTYR